MTYTGIDKTVVKGFKIIYMDKNKLLTHAYNNVVLQTTDYGIAVATATGEEHINYLKITDGYLFKYLLIGVKQNKGVLNPYYHLEITISELTDSNLKPLNIAEYLNMLTRIKDYLLNMYGLEVDFTTAYFDTLEINKTAVMDKPFKGYSHLLGLMGKLVPKKYKDRVYHTDNLNILKQLEFFNGLTHGKIYDKTRQLQERFKIVLDKQYLRIEYTLRSSKKIETALGTRTITDITDQAIKKYLDEQIEQDLIAPLKKHIAEGNKKLLLLASSIKATKKNWISIFIDKAMYSTLTYKTATKEDITIPLLLDIKQIEEAIKKLCGHNAKRNITTAQQQLNSLKGISNQIENFNEIIDKFL